MWEYVKRSGRSRPTPKSQAVAAPAKRAVTGELPLIDRTPKLFIAGKQARPDGAYTPRIASPSGAAVGEAPQGNRQDIRNAIQRAHPAKGLGGPTSHNRPQNLY